MFSSHSDLLFPPSCLPSIRETRGDEWRHLVNKVIQTGPNSLEQMAIVLMMSRMNNCLSCSADSYRSLTGCTACTKQSLRRFRESDDDLLKAYSSARDEIIQFIEKKISSQAGGILRHHRIPTG